MLIAMLKKEQSPFHQRSIDTSHFRALKGPGSKYFQLWKLKGFFSTTQLLPPTSHVTQKLSRAVNKWVGSAVTAEFP